MLHFPKLIQVHNTDTRVITGCYRNTKWYAIMRLSLVLKRQIYIWRPHKQAQNFPKNKLPYVSCI